MSSLPISDLSESAQNALADLIELLAAGFTGNVTIACADGGVKGVRVEGGKEAIAMLKESARQRRTLTEAHKPE